MTNKKIGQVQEAGKKEGEGSCGVCDDDEGTIFNRTDPIPHSSSNRMIGRKEENWRNSQRLVLINVIKSSVNPQKSEASVNDHCTDIVCIF